MAYSAKCSLFATFVAKYKPYYGKKGSQALRLTALFINSNNLCCYLHHGIAIPFVRAMTLDTH